MNHVYVPAARAECTHNKVGGDKRGLRVDAGIRRCKSDAQSEETSCWEF